MPTYRDVRRRLVNRVSRGVGLLHRLGVSTGRAQVLTTTGRRSGERRAASVGVVPMDGRRYVFQAYPRSAWVANVRADPTATLSDGRGPAEAVRLVEMPVAEGRELLRRQLTAEPAIGRQLVASGLVDDPTPDGVAAAAERIAVFRVDPR